MPEAPDQAVFLSYSSQDLETARLLADAMRTAGIVVWFDQRELLGGDQWDAKIRSQIHACALFVPVISANTQARLEGYFRIEWKLAAQRTHAMAEEKAFLVPVVIDSTRDADAKVPAEFKAVQWTRLPGGEPTPQFLARVQQLLAGEPAASVPPPPHKVAAGSRPSNLRTWALTAVIALVATSVWLWSTRRGDPPLARPAPPTATAVANATTPPPHSIAVLPFADLSGEKKNDYLLAGLEEDLVTDLSSIKTLKVVSRLSAAIYRGANKPLRQIGIELGAAFVLSGSIRREANSIRFSAQLIDTRTEQQVWAEKFDRELTNVLALQSALAKDIVPSLRVALQPAEQAALARTPTTSESAYDLYLRARQFRANFREEKFLENAEALLRQALALDPGFMRAWIELAGVHRERYSTFGDDRTETRLALVEQAIAKAQTLAPTAPDVLLGQGQIRHYCYRDYPGAIAIYQKLIADYPHYPEARNFLAFLYRRLGRWSEALEQWRLASRAEPGNPERAKTLMMMLAWVRRHEERIALGTAVEHFWPDDPEIKLMNAYADLIFSGSTAGINRWRTSLSRENLQAPATIVQQARFALITGNQTELLEFIRTHGFSSEFIGAAVLLFETGRRDEALGLLEHKIKPEIDRLQKTRPNGAQTHVLSAKYFALLGDRPAALRAIARARQLLPEEDDAINGVSNSAELAKALLWLGDKDAALAELDRLLKKPTNLWVNAMRTSVEWMALRGEPRFQAILSDPKNAAPLF